MIVKNARRAGLAVLLAASLAVSCSNGTTDPGEAEASSDTAAATSSADSPTADAETTTPGPSETASASASPATVDVSDADFVQELADRLPAEIAERGSMIWTGIPNPPTRIPTDTGPEGVEQDLASAFSQILGIEVELAEAGGLSDLLLAIESGRADLFIGPMASTRERQETFDFTVWLQTEAGFVFLAEMEDPPSDAEDLCGLTVSFIEASIFEEVVADISEACTADGREPIEPLAFGDREAALLAVNSGRANAHANALVTGLYYQTQNPGMYEIVSRPIGDEPEPLGGITSKTRPEWGELVFDVWTELFEQGVYEEILEKWNLTRAAVDEPKFNYAIS